jgi:hypothetical protein
MVEIETLTAENSKQTMMINQFKSSSVAANNEMDRERQQMQGRFTELCSRIDGLQAVHNETIPTILERARGTGIFREMLILAGRRMMLAGSIR